MMEKAYSLFLCVLLILVLFLPSTAAGRALLQTAQTEGEGGYHGGNGGSKMGVTGSHSNTAPSRTGVPSPSKPTPVGITYLKNGTLHVYPDRIAKLHAPHMYVTASEAYEVEVKWKIQNKENNSHNYSYLRS
ncbi:hypothetical protein AAG906_031664 [Vitis piasezkii]